MSMSIVLLGYSMLFRHNHRQECTSDLSWNKCIETYDIWTCMHRWQAAHKHLELELVLSTLEPGSLAPLSRLMCLQEMQPDLRLVVSTTSVQGQGTPRWRQHLKALPGFTEELKPDLVHIWLMCGRTTKKTCKLLNWGEISITVTGHWSEGALVRRVTAWSEGCGVGIHCREVVRIEAQQSKHSLSVSQTIILVLHVSLSHTLILI